MNQTICHYMIRIRIAFSAAAVPLVIASCATVPETPVRPELAVSQGVFNNAETPALSSEPVEIAWWRTFDDPVLTMLVEKSLAENKDVAVAEANLATTRAILARQGLLRSSSTGTSTSAEIGRAARGDADVELSTAGQFSASWEYDAFGRLAALIESATFQVEQFEEIRRDVAVTVAAETALAYADYRGNQVRLAVAQSNAELQKESVDLLRILFENGRATQLDLERAEAQYRTTMASLPLIELNVQTSARQLATLTGQLDVDEVLNILETGEAQSIPSSPEILNIGNPAALIRRRPDIRAAEAEISRRLALGEAERARLFPTLTFNADLFALIGEDSTLDNSIGFGVGPAIRWEGPDLRRVRADIDIADAQTRVAFAAYERVVVEALGEVEVALIGYLQEQARRSDLEAAAASAERALELAKLRFDEGLDDFLDVIDAQRTLLDAQDRLATSRLSTTRRAILTYRALGGIWKEVASSSFGAEGE